MSHCGLSQPLDHADVLTR